MYCMSVFYTLSLERGIHARRRRRRQIAEPTRLAMDEDLPHVAEALRGTVCIGVAFGTEWKKYRHGTATAEPMTQAVNGGAPCYVDHYGSGFFFHETGLVLTCEHVRQDCRRDINAHAGVLVVCPYKGPTETLDWSEAWIAEVVAHTANWDGTTGEPEDPAVPTLSGHDDAAVLISKRARKSAAWDANPGFRAHLAAPHLSPPPLLS